MAGKPTIWQIEKRPWDKRASGRDAKRLQNRRERRRARRDPECVPLYGRYEGYA